LSGTVNWQFEKLAAEECVRKLSGVVAVSNRINLTPRASQANIKTKIEAALKRHAELEAKAIRVFVKNDDHVVLEGKVDSWDERRAAEDAAWSAGGRERQISSPSAELVSEQGAGSATRIPDSSRAPDVTRIFARFAVYCR
jgi:hypothetical protein